MNSLLSTNCSQFLPDDDALETHSVIEDDVLLSVNEISGADRGPLWYNPESELVSFVQPVQEVNKSQTLLGVSSP